EAIVQRSVELLRLHLCSLSRSIAFPELCFPIRRSLTKFIASAKIARFRKVVQKLLSQIVANASFIEARRSDVGFAPKSLKATAEFSASLPKTPLEAYAEA